MNNPLQFQLPVFCEEVNTPLDVRFVGASFSLVTSTVKFPSMDALFSSLPTVSDDQAWGKFQSPEAVLGGGVIQG